MRLKWKSSRLHDETIITPENLQTVETNNHLHHVEANFGIFEISCNGGRIYKDGTRQWMIYVRVPRASSREIITLDKIRGHLADAILAAENALFATAYQTGG